MPPFLHILVDLYIGRGLCSEWHAVLLWKAKHITQGISSWRDQSP